MTNPGGHVLTNVYDDNGRVTEQTDPRGGSTKFAYGTTGDGSQTTITDPNGNVTVEDYTGGELTTITKGSGTRACLAIRIAQGSGAKS